MLRVLTWLVCLLTSKQVLSQEIAQREQSNKTFSIRIRGGDIPNEGRVEIYRSGEWGTMCDDGLNLEVANVICRTLGYDGAVDYVHSGKFGPGQGPVWLDDVQCTGEEETIKDCQHSGWGVHDCSHHEDAGVRCSKRRLPGYFKKNRGNTFGVEAVRLRPARRQRRYIPQFEGFVEVRHERKWTKICSREWDREVARVACGQLGFPGAEPIPEVDRYLAHAKKKHNYWLVNVTCSGIESELSECILHKTATPTRNCVGGGPFLTRCTSMFEETGGRKKSNKIRLTRRKQKSPEIRLKSGPLEGEGRLEVKRAGQWGTVCHRDFSILAANVACRQLGFGTAKRHLRNSFFGQGNGHIWLSNVRCFGNESYLNDCSHENLPRRNDGHREAPKEECSHSEDVGVACHTPDMRSNTKVRLVGGRNPMEGRLEVRLRKRWGPVCGVSFTAREASVVCRQLGLGFALNALQDAYFFPGSENASKVIMTGLKCTGDESTMQYCRHDGKALKQCGARTRTMTPYAGVICTEMSPDLVQDVRLLQDSIHLNDVPLHLLYCADEENCLTPSAKEMNWPYGSRRLLRFSTRVWNRGRADFRPARTPEEWIWHQCHGHYHSMAEFTHYDIVDLNFTKVAEGHKASFCLEDTHCDSGVSARFDCDQPGGGVQGIAVGCADNYASNIDCQWIDISDVPKGNYLIRIRVNPEALVPESDYGNNEVFCNLQYDGHRVWAWNCHVRDDFDEETSAPYFTEAVYP